MTTEQVRLVGMRMSDATTLSSPYRSRKAVVSSVPIWPRAPVTRIRFIVTDGTESAVPRATGFQGAGGALRSRRSCC